MKVLVVDVGGTSVKILASGQRTVRKFRSGPELTPKQMVAGVVNAAKGWKYDAVSIGYPGPVSRGTILKEPKHLGTGWAGFDFEKAFGCPVKLINDAAMQALGSYEGGIMLFLGLGTGLGSALIADDVIMPMELAHLPYKKGRTFEEYVGRRGLDRLGKKKWLRAVDDVVSRAASADHIDGVAAIARELPIRMITGLLGGHAQAMVLGIIGFLLLDRLGLRANPDAGAGPIGLVLMLGAVATLLAGVCGGVSQTTPYIGHPAYKAMGGRAAYTLATGLFVGLGGILGYIPFLAMILPIACLAPILIFVAFDIVSQAFQETPRAHGAAVCFAIFPSIAQLVLIILDKASPLLTTSALDAHRVAEALTMPLGFAENFGVFVVLAHGFILTGMLWGAALAFLIDRRIAASAVTLAIAGGLSLFGLIHSVLPTGGMYVPWSAALLGSRMPYHWTAAYLVAALMVLALGLGDRGEGPAALESK